MGIRKIVDAIDLKAGDRILGPRGPETVTASSERALFNGVDIHTDNDQGGYHTGLPCPVKVLD